MRIRLTILVIAAASQPAFADAQLIQVERGRVRAPFVRVERGWGSRTRVRAPFVEWNGNQRRYQYSQPQYQYSQPQSQYSQPQIPSDQPPVEPTPVRPETTAASAKVSEMDWLSLRQTVRSAEEELETELDDVAAAEHFRSALQVGTLRQLLAADVNAPPHEETTDQLREVLDAYDRASISPTFRPVSGLSGFQTVQSALRELLTPEQERARGRLIVAADELYASLNRMRNGATWVDYLGLPDSVYRTEDLARNHVAMQGRPAQPPLEEMTPVLTRFESVNGDSRYHAVTSLPEFEPTYRQLAMYVDLLSEPTPTVHEPPLPLEPIRSRGSKRD